MPCYSPLKGYSGPEGRLVFRKDQNRGGPMEVACGSCLGCRLDRSRMWAIRMVHESMLHDDNCFITLTYDEDKMPRLFSGGPGTLVKEHFQKFMKRLRKRFPDFRIKYYHCGEYGDQLSRPHYHANLFGFDFEDYELIGQSKDQPLYTSQVLSDLWQLGFVTVAPFTFETAAYTARYITKKVTGHKAPDHYMRVDEYGVCYWLEPEYSTMSRGGRHGKGLGADWYAKYKDDCFPSDDVPVPGIGVLPKAPRYYETILQAEDPGLHEEVKRLRKVFRQHHKEDYTPHRLWQKYKVKLDQISTLTRGYENET